VTAPRTCDAFEYDARGNLVAEHQGHGAVAVQGTTPRVGYTWEFKGVDEGNYDRVTGITYPARVGGTSYSVSFDYGGSGSIDSGSGRVAGIRVPDISSTPVASYEYAGSSRRVSTTWGNGVGQTFGGVIPIGGGSGGGDPAGGYLGLDRFGRVKDLLFQNSGGTIHQYQYGYDLAGNRTFARVRQASTDDDGDPLTDPTPHDNDRSWLYAYDRLNRLSDAMMGQLTEDNQGIAYGG